MLYGPSGVGKSSLLAAAVARRLRELPEHPVVVVFSTWSERPAAAIARAVCAEAGIEPTDSLDDAVQRACEARGDVYLLLDQAEEYFLYHPAGRPARARARRAARARPRGPTSCSRCARTRWRSSTVSRRRSPASSTTTSDSTASRARPAARPSCEPLARWHELGGRAGGDRAGSHESACSTRSRPGGSGAGLGGTGQVGARHRRGDDRGAVPPARAGTDLGGRASPAIVDPCAWRRSSSSVVPPRSSPRTSSARWRRSPRPSRRSPRSCSGSS